MSAETLPAETQINQTWLAQPAIFVVEYALARLWMSWGVKPAVLIGHSIGEYVAAVLAEAFTLEDALALLSVRARLMQALPAGSMLAVRLGAGEVERLLPDGASIAAVNSPVLCAVSGPTNLIQEFQQELESKGIAARFLHTSHAFHSAMMDPMLPEFAAAARQIPNQAAEAALGVHLHRPLDESGGSCRRRVLGAAGASNGSFCRGARVGHRGCAEYPAGGRAGSDPQSAGPAACQKAGRCDGDRKFGPGRRTGTRPFLYAGRARPAVDCRCRHRLGGVFCAENGADG